MDGYFASAARKVRIPQPGNSMGPLTAAPSSSRGLLSVTCVGAGSDQVTAAFCGISVALKSRSISALPSWLGFSEVTITSGGSTRNNDG